MTILAHLDRRADRRGVRRNVREHRARARHIIQHERPAARARYAAGLPAEESSLVSILGGAKRTLRSLRQEVRREALRRCGRTIDLWGLMRMLREDGSPLWALVDPRRPIDGHNGQIDTDGTLYWGGDWLTYLVPGESRAKRGFRPVGMPALPPSVRALCRDRAINRRAKRMGILYQTEEWQEVNPDPALVVEWADLPGEYYCLAVWGVDGPTIMEFVD